MQQIDCGEFIIPGLSHSDFNSQNNMIPACAKSCNLLDCHPNSNMQMRLLPLNMKKGKNIKMGQESGQPQEQQE